MPVQLYLAVKSIRTQVRLAGALWAQRMNIIIITLPIRTDLCTVKSSSLPARSISILAWSWVRLAAGVLQIAKTISPGLRPLLAEGLLGWTCKEHSMWCMQYTRPKISGDPFGDLRYTINNAALSCLWCQRDGAKSSETRNKLELKISIHVQTNHLQ